MTSTKAMETSASRVSADRTPRGRSAIARFAGKLLLVGLAIAALESVTHARPWEPIETSLDYDEPAFRKGMLVLPSFGLVAPADNDKARVAEVGFRMSAILGWHLLPQFSLNGQLSLSVLRFQTDDANRDADTEFLFDYALAPLFHLGTRNIEVVMGPTLGRFRYSLPEALDGDRPLSRSTGWSYGVNWGILAPVQTMALGGLLTYTVNHATEICDPACHARTSTVGDLHVLAVSFAMLY